MENNVWPYRQQSAIQVADNILAKSILDQILLEFKKTQLLIKIDIVYKIETKKNFSN